VANPPIIGFYSGTQPDHRGRYLNEIQGSPDAQLESVHDYIQWLFPLPERSGFNVAAPVLTQESIHEFYGFEARLGERITVTRAPNFAAKAAGWLSPGDHNHLRMTRILRCLTVLGLEAEAKALFDCLCKIYEDEQKKPLPAISDETMLYWKEAVGDAGIG